MEIQLKELIDQIKKDGVDAAEVTAASIVADANAKAEQIISEAKAKAEKMIADAKEQNQRNVKVSEDAIKQAGRNLLISFRDSVIKQLNAIIGEQVSKVYSSDEISSLVVNVVEAWTKKSDSDDVSVLLNSKDAERLEACLVSALKERLVTGVTIKPNDSFDGGFRIAVNNGSAYYDYSAEAVTDMLSAYLTPKVTSLMKEAENI